MRWLGPKPKSLQDAAERGLGAPCYAKNASAPHGCLTLRTEAWHRAKDEILTDLDLRAKRPYADDSWLQAQGPTRHRDPQAIAALLPVDGYVDVNGYRVDRKTEVLVDGWTTEVVGREMRTLLVSNSSLGDHGNAARRRS